MRLTLEHGWGPCRCFFDVISCTIMYIHFGCRHLLNFIYCYIIFRTAVIDCDSNVVADLIVEMCPSIFWGLTSHNICISHHLHLTKSTSHNIYISLTSHNHVVSPHGLPIAARAMSLRFPCPSTPDSRRCLHGGGHGNGGLNGDVLWLNNGLTIGKP